MIDTEAPRSRHRKRWPISQEWARQAVMDDAENARVLIRASITRIATVRERLARAPTDRQADADLADAIADQAQALALLADIQRKLVEAKLGRDE